MCQRYIANRNHKTDKASGMTTQARVQAENNNNNNNDNILIGGEEHEKHRLLQCRHEHADNRSQAENSCASSTLFCVVFVNIIYFSCTLPW